MNYVWPIDPNGLRCWNKSGGHRFKESLSGGLFCQRCLTRVNRAGLLLKIPPAEWKAQFGELDVVNRLLGD